MRKVILLFGASEDKDINGMLDELIPRVSRAVVTRSTHPRASQPEDLATMFRAHGCAAEVVEDPRQALIRTIELASDQDVVLTAGSVFIAAAVLAEWPSVNRDFIRKESSSFADLSSAEIYQRNPPWRGWNMSGQNFREWQLRSEFAEVLGSRTEELARIQESTVDRDGLITCSGSSATGSCTLPHMVTPLFVGREGALSALEYAHTAGQTVIVATQKRSGSR